MFAKVGPALYLWRYNFHYVFTIPEIFQKLYIHMQLFHVIHAFMSLMAALVSWQYKTSLEHTTGPVGIVVALA